MNFYNFKHDIISSTFTEGNVTKDNLCKIYGIDNILEVHTGANDCLLEWQLFKKMNGNKLLITNNNVFELNDNYIIPASYLSTYPNFKYCFTSFPKLEYKTRVVKKIEINTKKAKKFETNISGMTIEHLINILLNVKKIDSSKFLIENKSKLKYIGRLPSIYDDILVNFNNDGTITAINKKDEKKVNEINEVIEELKKNITPLIFYIKNNIFKNKEILSQELVFSKDKKVLAICDLSNQKSVLEIKSYSFNMEKMKYQLYYEMNGRNCYVMNIDWSKASKKLTFIISHVNCSLKETKKKNNVQNGKRTINKIYTIQEYRDNMKCKDIQLIEYGGLLNNGVKLQCNTCNKKWNTTYSNGLKIKKCPFCSNKYKLSSEERIQNRTIRYREKVQQRSNGNIEILSYISSKEKVNAKCLICNYEWHIRADHLLERCYCPNCK